MRNLVLTFTLIFIRLCGWSQQPKYKPSYHQLKDYEGYYQFINHGTLQMAVSPRDTVLYAIINQARYPLKAASADIFLDNSKQPVKFLRDAFNRITGYTYKADTLKLINKNVHFAKEMWYPRLPDAVNSYP